MTKIGRIEPRGKPASKHSPAKEAIRLSLNNVSAAGSVVAIIHSAPPEEVRMAPEQKMTKIKSGGHVVQSANVAVDQVMDDIDAAGDARQLIDIGSPDLREIAGQIVVLKTKLLEFDPAAQAEADRLDAAKAAAEAGDTPTMLSSLKGLARWVGRFAKDVGVAAVADLIEKSAGLS